MTDPISRIERALDTICTACAAWTKGGRVTASDAQYLLGVANSARSEVRAMRGATRDYIPEAVRRAVFKRARNRCQMSGCSAPAVHVDHIVPVARFGASTADNLQALCAACNTRKGAT